MPRFPISLYATVDGLRLIDLMEDAPIVRRDVVGIEKKPFLYYSCFNCLFEIRGRLYTSLETCYGSGYLDASSEEVGE